MKPKLLILDEPTSALDRSVQLQIIALLRQLQSDHRLAYLFISHDLKVVRALANTLIVMHQGRVVEQGAADLLFQSPPKALHPVPDGRRFQWHRREQAAF